MSSPDEALLDSLNDLRGVDISDRDAIGVVTDTWEQLLRQSPALVSALYAHYLGSVERLLDRPTSLPGFDGLDAYRYVLTFSSLGYARPARREATAELTRHHSHHLELLEAALAHDDVRFCEAPSRLSTGTFSDVVASMLELYRWHTDHTDTSASLRADAAAHVLTYFRTFPDADRFIVAGLLEFSRDVVADTAELLRFYLLEHTASEGPVRSVALDLIGAHARKGDPLHDESAAIFTRLLTDSAQWPAATASRFVDLFVRYPLRLSTVTQDDAAGKVRQAIAAQLATAERKQAAGVTDADFDVSGHTRELDLITNDFASWQDRRHRRALQQLSGSAGSRKALTAAARRLPDAEAAFVQRLLSDVAEHRNRPKRFPIAAPANNQFADFGLKLLVIEELMYRQQVLTPRFDLAEFAQEYDKREINAEKDGYAIVPEVQRYFRNLAIPADLLAQVRTLHQSSGLDGGAEIMTHLFPFWDPGMGDDAIAVTAKAVRDLPLLPNLTRISGLENSRPNRTLVKALHDRGVEMVTEEQ